MNFFCKTNLRFYDKYNSTFDPSLNFSHLLISLSHSGGDSPKDLAREGGGEIQVSVSKT